MSPLQILAETVIGDTKPHVRGHLLSPNPRQPAKLGSEVEEALYELDQIAEAAVFGLPDERLGEAVAAAVVLVPGTELDEAALNKHLDGRLARFKHPRRVWFLDEALPRNANGKFLKRELRERFASTP